MLLKEANKITAKVLGGITYLFVISKCNYNFQMISVSFITRPKSAKHKITLRISLKNSVINNFILVINNILILKVYTRITKF